MIALCGELGGTTEALNGGGTPEGAERGFCCEEGDSGQWESLGKDLRSVHWQHCRQGEGKLFLWGEQRRQNELEVSEVVEVLPILATGYRRDVGVSAVRATVGEHLLSLLSASLPVVLSPHLNVHVHNCWDLVMLRETGDTWRALAQGWACSRVEECVLCVSQEQLFYVVALGNSPWLFSFDV